MINFCQLSKGTDLAKVKNRNHRDRGRCGQSATDICALRGNVRNRTVAAVEQRVPLARQAGGLGG